MNTTENLRFDNAEIRFKDKQVHVLIFSREADFVIGFDCWHLDWQVSSMAQISNAFNQVFSAVEHLTLGHEVHTSEEHDNVDRTEWRNILRSFSTVKTLRVEDGLVEELSHCLRLEGRELPLEILPELQKLTYFDERVAFVDERIVGVDERVAHIDEMIARVDERIAGVDKRIAGVDEMIAGVDNRVRVIDGTQYDQSSKLSNS